jgi:hypothetical protein
MERKFMSLQQMFLDAQEVEDNLQACGKLPDQIEDKKLDIEEHESDHEQKAIDLNFEQRVNKIMHFLEVSNVDVFAENNEQFSDPQVVVPKHFVADLNFKSFHHEQNVDFAMNFFKIFSEECHESEFADQLVEEKVDVPSFFMLDDIAGVHDFPKYDEYDDDYVVDFGVDLLEQPSAFSPSGNNYFQQSPSYAIEYEENSESVEGNSLPLCFSSFEFLKKNLKSSLNKKGCELMQGHIVSLEQIDNKLQQPSHVFHDPVACYMEGFNSQNLQPTISCKTGNIDDGQLMSEPVITFFPARVLSHSFMHIFIICLTTISWICMEAGMQMKGCIHGM